MTEPTDAELNAIMFSTHGFSEGMRALYNAGAMAEGEKYAHAVEACTYLLSRDATIVSGEIRLPFKDHASALAALILARVSLEDSKALADGGVSE